MQYEQYKPGNEDDDGCHLQGKGEGEVIVQPAEDRSDGCEYQADDEVPDGEHRSPHFGKGLLVDIAFQDGGGKSPYNIE